jgi:DNA-binding transcriptional ArsR family regulator
MFRKILFAAVAICITAPAAAQKPDWKLTPYLWASGLDGSATIGPVTGDVAMDFGDIVDVLRGAGLVRLEVQGKRHGLFGDLVYMRLKEEEARDTIGGTLELKLDALIIEGAYFYRLNNQYALELGARYWDFETTLSPALLPSVKRTRDFVDAFIGFRSELDINANWNLLFRGNVGGGDSDFSAGLQLDFRRKFASGNTLDLGLRVLDIDYQDGQGLTGVGLDMTMQGLAIGYTFDL